MHYTTGDVSRKNTFETRSVMKIKEITNNILMLLPVIQETL